MKIGFILFSVFLYSGVHTASAKEIANIQEALSSGKKCTATWSSESSKAGQKTTIFDFRKLNGKTQYQVYHFSQRPKYGLETLELEKLNVDKNVIG